MPRTNSQGLSAISILACYTAANAVHYSIRDFNADLVVKRTNPAGLSAPPARTQQLCASLSLTADKPCGRVRHHSFPAKPLTKVRTDAAGNRK